MNILDIILILACSYMEYSQKINTDNIIEKIGMLSIVIGAAMNLSGVANHLIDAGAALYFTTIAYKGCMSKHDRRKSDHTPRKRKILS